MPLRYQHAKLDLDDAMKDMSWRLQTPTFADRVLRCQYG
jgi:hypothetical protein